MIDNPPLAPRSAGHDVDSKGPFDNLVGTGKPRLPDL
jgi:hypothetical protein